MLHKTNKSTKKTDTEVYLPQKLINNLPKNA